MKTFFPRPARRHGFTLIELLVVISIIAVIAALTIPALAAVKKAQYLSQAKAELGRLEAAINSYKEAKGFYPPDSSNGPLTNQLYYELSGTQTNGAAPVAFRTLDARSTVAATDLPALFGIAGFVNCAKGTGEDDAKAKNYLGELKARQYGTGTIGGVSDVSLLTCAVGGPDQNYLPTPVGNPWRYLANGTNNPGGYDLWVQLQISGKKYLVCNWSKQVQVNYPLP